MKKCHRRLPGFDYNVIALYVRALMTREIQEHLLDLYHVEVSPTLISRRATSLIACVDGLKGFPPPEIRKAIHTSSAIELINASLRKVTRKRGRSRTRTRSGR